MLPTRSCYLDNSHWHFSVGRDVQIPRISSPRLAYLDNLQGIKWERQCTEFRATVVKFEIRADRLLSLGSEDDKLSREGKLAAGNSHPGQVIVVESDLKSGVSCMYACREL